MNCKDCIFGRKPGEEFSNACYRYPDPERVASEHWCGEWSHHEVQLARFVYPKPIDSKPVLRLPRK